MRIAVIGDVHGCIDELKQLYDALSELTLDEIWVTGDLVDRGPDSGAVVRFCREKGIRAVFGNHEESVLNQRKTLSRGGKAKNDDKLRTNSQLSDEDAAWLESLPRLHFCAPLNLVIVHGGLWPGREMWEQPANVCRAQMIHPDKLGMSRWWGPAAITSLSGFSEEQSREEGFERWYRLYDGPWNVVYGHSVFIQPFIHQNEGCGKTIGIDTGSCFGGALTAMIMDERQLPVFLAVKAKQHYAEIKKFSLEEL